jgi:hypothetical protein
MNSAIGSAMTASIDRDGGGDPERAQRDPPVDGLPDQGLEVVQGGTRTRSPVNEFTCQKAAATWTPSEP